MKRFRVRLPLLLLLLLPLDAQRRDPLLLVPARGTRAALAAGSNVSADAGMRLLHAGGNAVDAGVAAAFAAAAMEFSHVGMGGEMPILIRDKTGKVHSIAGIGTMPKLATADFYRKRKPLPAEVMVMEPNGLTNFVPVYGMLPVIVPGLVEAGLVALRDFGSRSFEEVIAPAIELADGFVLDETRFQALIMFRKHAAAWPTSQKVFLPDAKPGEPGQIFRQPDLARTLRAMAAQEKQALAAGKNRTAAIDAVRDYFYRGEIARKIDAFSKANQGFIRYEDMAAFKLTPEPALNTTYRGYTVHKPGFWSQGPAMLQTLNILEGFDMKAKGLNTEDYIHTVTEALKLAYADRDTYYGDPRMAKIPDTVLLSREYAAARRAEIGPKAANQFRPGVINGKAGTHPSTVETAKLEMPEGLAARDTTSIAVIDKDGMAFAATPSGSWLPAVIAGDTGIPLSHRAQSFLLIPGHPNELAPGKRPRVTLSPTLVERDGKPFMAMATPGGDVQEQAMLQVFLTTVEFGYPAEYAIEAPRFQTKHLVSSFDNHSIGAGELLVDERIPTTVRAGLSTLGHRSQRASMWSAGAAPVIVRVLEGGTFEAAGDPYGYRVTRAW